MSPGPSAEYLTPLGYPLYDVCHPYFAGGADPTGSTDSTKAIHAARDWVGSAGGLFFGSGIYAVSGLQHKWSKQGWYGAGPGATVLVPSPSYEGTLLDINCAAGFNGYYTLWGMTLNGISAAQSPNGIYLEDQSSSGLVALVEVKNCGVGVANASHAQSTSFWRLNSSYNNVGVQWVKYGQQTAFRDSRIVGNALNQVQLGDDSQAVAGPIRFVDTNLQSSGPTQAQSNVLIKSCSLVIFDGCYWESQTYSASCDIEVASSAQSACKVVVRDNNNNGNAAAASSIKVDSGVSGTVLILDAGRWTGYTGSVVSDSGTGTSQLHWGTHENGVFIPAQYNGNNLVWP